jgi:hypothetical protein
MRYDASTLYAIERGANAPSFLIIVKLAMVLGASETAFFIWPGVNDRHDLWEMIYETPDDELPALKEAMMASRARLKRPSRREPELAIHRK